MVLRNLKGYRAKHNITQEEIANKLGISVVAYRNKENGHTQFTLSEVKTISDLFKANIKDIFFNDEVYKEETI